MTTGISIAHTASLKELGLLDNSGLPVGGGLAVTTLNAPANSSTDSSTWATLALGKHTIVTGLTGDTIIKLPAGATKAAWKITVDGNQLSGYRVTLLAAGSDAISYDGITTHSSAKIVNASDWLEGSWVGPYWTLNNGATRGGVPSSYSTTTKRTKQIDLSLSCSRSGWAGVYAKGVFYADSTGSWRLAFNISGTFTEASISTLQVDINNCKPAGTQSVSGLLGGSSPSALIQSYIVQSVSSGKVYVNAVTAGNVSSFFASGDIYLLEEPTAYTIAANMENVLSSDVYIPNVSGSTAGLVPASNSNLDDASATRLGLKQYLIGSTYNGGVTIGVSGGVTVSRGILVPYQLNDGTWRMRFNITCTQTSASSTIINLTSVAYPYSEAISASNGVAALITSNVYDGGYIYLEAASAYTNVKVSGDVAITAKPNWAY